MLVTLVILQDKSPACIHNQLIKTQYTQTYSLSIYLFIHNLQEYQLNINFQYLCVADISDYFLACHIHLVCLEAQLKVINAYCIDTLLLHIVYV